MLCSFSLVAESRGYSLLLARGLPVAVASLGSRARGRSSCGSQAPGHRLSSCGPGAYLPQNMWDLPGSGIKPVSPALPGGFFTTEPPGKPSHYSLYREKVQFLPQADICS